jgi:hypothetical protein
MKIIPFFFLFLLLRRNVKLSLCGFVKEREREKGERKTKAGHHSTHIRRRSFGFRTSILVCRAPRLGTRLQARVLSPYRAPAFVARAFFAARTAHHGPPPGFPGLLDPYFLFLPRFSFLNIDLFVVLNCRKESHARAHGRTTHVHKKRGRAPRRLACAV